MTIRDDLVEALAHELRRQASGRTETVCRTRITILRRVDLDVDELIEVVLGELYAGWGSIGEIQ